MVESANERAGGLWKYISQPSLLCDNCGKELPDDAEINKGKFPMANLKKQNVAYWCKACYYYYRNRNREDIKAKRKLV